MEREQEKERWIMDLQCFGYFNRLVKWFREWFVNGLMFAILMGQHWTPRYRPARRPAERWRRGRHAAFFFGCLLRKHKMFQDFKATYRVRHMYFHIFLPQCRSGWKRREWQNWKKWVLLSTIYKKSRTGIDMNWQVWAEAAEDFLVCFHHARVYVWCLTAVVLIQPLRVYARMSHKWFVQMSSDTLQ